jgi:hypothetical protein
MHKLPGTTEAALTFLKSVTPTWQHQDATFNICPLKKIHILPYTSILHYAIAIDSRIVNYRTLLLLKALQIA